MYIRCLDVFYIFGCLGCLLGTFIFVLGPVTQGVKFFFERILVNDFYQAFYLNDFNLLFLFHSFCLMFVWFYVFTLKSLSI